MRLLVLDDDEPIASSMAAMASRRSWDAQAVTREADFQALIEAAPPDAIILDLQLGDSDGIEQLHFLHSVRYRGAIVLMSGFNTRVLAAAQQIGQSLGLFIAAAIEKPVPAARLGDVLSSIERHGSGTQSPQAKAQEFPLSVTPEDIVEAIDAGRMELHLQPIVAAADHVVTEAEALIRWQHPVLGLVPPEQFIPSIEQDARVMDRLTMWVTETAVAQHCRLAAQGRTVRVFVNISSQALRSHDFPDRIAGVLERLAAPQGAIGLEITESVAMQDLDTTAAVLARLRLKGFPVALDDFGTGHASLSALHRMPFSAVKIDKSFVAGMETSTESLMIVRSVIELAHSMGLTCIAEGVTTAGAARQLRDLGTDGLQGYYFSGPLPLDGFAHWLDAWSRGQDGQA
jgi:EAL domain-containing protein (putative c-di-GMP-specific phosphodiesterase class I)/ActR/RegA family two-component response regulator